MQQQQAGQESTLVLRLNTRTLSRAAVNLLSRASSASIFPLLAGSHTSRKLLDAYGPPRASSSAGDRASRANCTTWALLRESASWVRPCSSEGWLAMRESLLRQGSSTHVGQRAHGASS